MRPPFLACAVEFRHRKAVLKSCLTAVRVPELQMHADHMAESDSKRRATVALARDADPIVVGQTFNRGVAVVPCHRRSLMLALFPGLYTYRQG